MSSKILVTGADGFIGSHLVERLAGGRSSVRAFVFYNSFGSAGWLDTVDPSILADVEIFRGDIRDKDLVAAAVDGCDRVLHLAALISIPYSYIAPQSFIDTNVTGTLNILNAARDKGIDKVVVTSSSEVYGSAQSVPITESHRLHAQSPYAATKTAADQLAISFHLAFGLPITILRPFNTYGPRQSMRAILPTIITQLAAGQTRVKLGVTHPTRDFTFVLDTVAGMIAAADPAVALGEAINLGSDFEISIADAVNMVGDIMGVEPQIETTSERVRPAESEVERLWANNSRAQEVLGWSPSYGKREGLRRGLERTIEWYLEPQNLEHFQADRYSI